MDTIHIKLSWFGPREQSLFCTIFSILHSRFNADPEQNWCRSCSAMGTLACTVYDMSVYHNYFNFSHYNVVTFLPATVQIRIHVHVRVVTETVSVNSLIYLSSSGGDGSGDKLDLTASSFLIQASTLFSYSLMRLSCSSSESFSPLAILLYCNESQDDM